MSQRSWRLDALLVLIAQGCGAPDGETPEQGLPSEQMATEQRQASGGQTGDDSGSTTANCVVVQATPLAMDELSPLGFAPNAPLALALGSHVSPLEWIEASWAFAEDDRRIFPYGPEHGAGELQLDLELREGSVRFVDREDPAAPGACPDWVEVDVSVALATSGGALQERFDATLSMMSDDMAQLEGTLPADALSGTFELDADALGELRVSEFVVSSRFTRYGIVGGLQAVLEQDGPGGTGRARQPAPDIAVWPTKQPCSGAGAGIPMLDTSARPSAEDLLQAVRGANPMGVFTDGVATAPVEVRIEPVDRWACFQPALPQREEIAFWTLGAELQIVSEALPGARPLRVMLKGQTPSWSTQLGVSLSVQGSCADAGAQSVADFQRECGDWSIDLSPYDGAFLELWQTAFGNGGGYADLVITGVKSPGCTWGPAGPVCPEAAGSQRTAERAGQIHFGSTQLESE